ncbi:MAG TPA: DNA gyrase inhibitor YacG [Casimicrobiaceae bacterium]|nr:DNA gyrase inhibitor YacG [Casimicrobiaceae bacterium]
MTTPPRIVKCPQCGAPVPWTAESKWRPFCSERCKTIDLGAWASERYRIATPEAPDDEDSVPDDTGRDQT